MEGPKAIKSGFLATSTSLNLPIFYSGPLATGKLYRRIIVHVSSHGAVKMGENSLAIRLGQKNL